MKKLSQDVTWKMAKHADRQARSTIKGIRAEVIGKVVEESSGGVRLHFPTFSVCPVCSGHYGENTIQYNHGIPVLNCTADENYQLALIQFGYYLAKWEGANISATTYMPHPCTCKCNHQWEETFRPSTPRGGIHGARCVKCGIKMEHDTSD